MPKRVVFSTFGSLGDLHPYLSVARELRDRGHVPVIATSAIYREKVEAEGLEFAPIRPNESDFGDPEEVFRKINHPWFGTPFIFNRLILPHLRASYDDLMAATGNAELLVSQALTFAVPMVAEKRGLSWVGTMLQPIGMLSESDPPYFTIAPWLPRLRRLSPGLHHAFFRAARLSFVLLGGPIRRLRRDLGLRPGPADLILSGQFSPRLNLALFSPLLAPPQPDWPPATVATGFPFYDGGKIGYEKLDPRLRAFLDEGPAPIVFTLGSSVVRAPGHFFRETFKLLETLDVRAVVVAAPALKAAARALPPRVLRVPYAPYGELFSHAAVIVHQGGIGTTGQALRAGRPQLVVPHAHDQPDNGARVARLGAGLMIDPRHYTASRAGALLRTLLSEEPFKRRAAEVGAAIRSEHGSRTAAEAIESLLSRSAGG